MKIKRTIKHNKDGWWVAYKGKMGVHVNYYRQYLTDITFSAMLIELGSPEEFTITVEAKK